MLHQMETNIFHNGSASFTFNKQYQVQMFTHWEAVFIHLKMHQMLSWRLHMFEVWDGDDDQQISTNCGEDHEQHKNIHGHFNYS